MKNDFYPILIAPDSFKESLSAKEVCIHLEAGIHQVHKKVQVISLPLADGGEGTVEAIVGALGGELIEASVHDPLMRKIIAQYGIVREQKLAIIEMAAASGLELLTEEELDPMVTTTYGTGEMILHALDQGCRKFIIGIGGSATNDGGTGMLEALKADFQFKNKVQLKGGGSLADLSKIGLETLDARLQEAVFDIACDVTNPLTGKNGATHIFGAQKGATPAMIEKLERNMVHFGSLLEAASGRSIVSVPGSGAAGGLGAGFLALPQAKLRSGFEIVAEAVGLEEAVQQARLIITGEGKVDGQTVLGKVPYGVGRIAKKYNKPVICVAGTVGPGSDSLLKHGVTAIFSIVDQPVTLEEAKRNAPLLLENLGGQLIRLIMAVSTVDPM